MERGKFYLYFMIKVKGIKILYFFEKVACNNNSVMNKVVVHSQPMEL